MQKQFALDHEDPQADRCWVPKKTTNNNYKNKYIIVSLSQISAHIWLPRKWRGKEASESTATVQLQKVLQNPEFFSLFTFLISNHMQCRRKFDIVNQESDQYASFIIKIRKRKRKKEVIFTLWMSTGPPFLVATIGSPCAAAYISTNKQRSKFHFLDRMKLTSWKVRLNQNQPRSR